MKKAKLYKKIRYALGYPIIRINLCDDQMNTMLEIATEDIDLICQKHQKKLPKKLKETLIITLAIAETKKAFARTRLMYSTPDPDKIIIDYEKLITDAKETAQLIYDLIPKLDIYYKNEQW